MKFLSCFFIIPFLFLLFSCVGTPSLPSEHKENFPPQFQPEKPSDEMPPQEGKKTEEEDASREEAQKTPDKESMVVAAVEESVKDEERSEERPEREEVSLSDRQIVNSIRRYETEEYRLLFDGSSPFMFRKDIDLLEPPEILAVFIDGPEESKGGPPQIDRLSDISRLYSEENTIFTCKVNVFYQSNNRIVPLNSYYLGKHRVLESIRDISLNQFAPLPFAVVFTFQSNQGSNKEWLIFYPNGTARFQIHEGLSSYSDVVDIDGDGMLDIIVYERIFEEGIGYETFVTWYRWEGKAFGEFKTINVVRNLTLFLSKAKQLIIEKQCDRFVEEALQSSQVNTLKKQGFSSEDICTATFLPVEGQDYPPSLKAMEITDIVYPEIVEDPFTLTEEKKRIFPMQIRVNTTEGSYLYRAVLKMSENPFFGRQFYFLVNPILLE